jgi:hypothetical protein
MEDLLAVAPDDLAELEENYTNKRVQAFLRSWRMELSS